MENYETEIERLKGSIEALAIIAASSLMGSNPSEEDRRKLGELLKSVSITGVEGLSPTARSGFGDTMMVIRETAGLD